MSLVQELAASVQCCFELFGTQSDGVLLSKHDQSQLNEISSILQPILLRLQKQAVSLAETQELFAEDEQLLEAVVHLRRALEALQAVVGRARVSHWLVRCLIAEEVRRGLESGLADTAAAMDELLEADAAADVGPLYEVCALQQSLLQHKVVRQEALERLGAGLYKHMESAADAEQVVAMLRFVVREAQNQMMRRKHGRPSSSNSSRRGSDASDTGPSRGPDQDSKYNADNNNHGDSHGDAVAATSTSPMDTGSSSDGSNGSNNHNKNESSGSEAGPSSGSKGRGKPTDVPPGETSLTDVQLLLAVQQLADTRQGAEQLVLHQVLSILEELHEQKAHALKHKANKNRAAAATNNNGPLQSVPEGVDDTIAAVRAASDSQQYSSQAADAAAMAAARFAGSNGQPVTYGTAVAAVAGGLEELLWADPWDTAALTQLLELLLQAVAEEEFVEVHEDDADNGSNSSSTSSGHRNNNAGKDGSSKGGRRKWWGQMGAAAKAALQSARSSSSSTRSSGKAAAKAAADKAAEAQQCARQERSHQMVSAALDVLLRLTPLPQDAESCFKPLCRPDISEARSLALPLMAHCDAVKGLSGCVWSSWNDVATKAARLITILARSEAAVNEGSAMAVAAGLASPPAAVYGSFCHNLCTTGGVGSSAWHGLVTLLHNSNLSVAAAAAEAIAAISSSSRSHELCSSLAASQAARALLLLLSKHQLHIGAGGAAAAALYVLSDARVRPGMHDLLVSSYTEQVNGTSVPLGDSCVAVMLSSDCLAACRAARLAASVAHGVNWATAALSSNSSSAGSLWGETFRAGQHLLQRCRSSSSSGGEEGSPTVAGALLLRQLVVYGCPVGGSQEGGDAAAGVDGGEGRPREDLCLEALVLVMQKLQSYDVVRAGKEGQVQALIELLRALVSHMSEGRVCGALPELFGVVVPLLEALQRKGVSGDSGGELMVSAQQLHEQLMVLGG